MYQGFQARTNINLKVGEIMKRYFYIALGVVFAFIFCLIFYGAYINYSDEAVIAESMAANHSIPLKGAKATVRQIHPKITIEVAELFSKEKTDAVALIEGIITSVNSQTNKTIKKGEVLFTIRNDALPSKIRQADIDILKAEGEILKSDNDIVKAETALSQASHDLERYTRLRDKEAVSLGKFEQIEMTFKEAQINLQTLKLQKQQVIAQRDSLKAQKEQLLIQSSYSNVTAPIDGEVLIIYKQVGSFVTQGTSLALIGNFDDLFFEMTAEDKIVRQLVSGKKATLSFLQKELQKIYGTEYKPGNEGHSQVFDADIIEITPSLDSPSAMRKIIWHIDNQFGILEPRAYSDIVCQSVIPRRCLTVPLLAVNNQKDSLFVFSQDGTIKKVSIITGADDGEFIEVLQGLNEGDIVVATNADNLTDGMHADFILEEGEDVGK